MLRSLIIDYNYAVILKNDCADKKNVSLNGLVAFCDVSLKLPGIKWFVLRGCESFKRVLTNTKHAYVYVSCGRYKYTFPFAVNSCVLISHG